MSKEIKVLTLEVFIEGDESLEKHVKRRLQQSCNEIHGGTVGLVLRDDDDNVVFSVVNGPLSETLATEMAS